MDRHITNIKVNLAVHLFVVSKLSTGLPTGVMADTFTCVGWQITLCDPM